MAANPYLERMEQLDQEKRRSKEQTLDTGVLPLHKPMNNQVNGVPTQSSPKPKEDESYKDSHFYMNFNNFQQNDPHFGGVVDQLTQLATGLRQQVEQGYMPQQIAEQRLRQYVQDTQQQFVRRKPQLEKEQKDAEEQQQMMGILSGLQQGQQAGQQQAQQEQLNRPEGVSAQQANQMEANNG